MSIRQRLEQIHQEQQRAGGDAQSKTFSVSPRNPQAGPALARPLPPDHAEMVLGVVTRLAEETGRPAADDDAGRGPARKGAALVQAAEEKLNEELAERGRALSRSERERVLADVVNEVVGLGPIQPLIADQDVSEVMVNGPKTVYVERQGKILETDVTFRDDAHVMHTIEKILAPLGRRIDELSPMVDARLSDGSRVNAVVPPVSVYGPTLTIRKFSAEPLRADDLVGFGTLTPELALLLDACVRGKINIIVSGGTATGKTTLLNVLSAFIPEFERIITIEDAAELRLIQRHVVTLESRPAGVEGNGRVTIRDLVINALRMRPDRIVVGEVRGGEALDMLQAMNTGHEGSLTTAHANSPRDLFSRLETMVLMAGTELPVRAIREQMAAALDLIVHLERLQDGTRKVVRVTEVLGMEGDTVTTQDLFDFSLEGYDDEGRAKGFCRPTGIVPHFLDTLKARGVHVDQSIFLGF